MWILAATLALVSPDGSQVEKERSTEAPPSNERPRNYASFRVGADATVIERPQMCLDVTPLDGIGFEACGNGGGFLYSAVNGRDFAHFRGRARLASTQVEGVWLEPWVAVGFAELEVGADTPGFDFGGTSPGNVSTAGPDVGASVRALLPLWAGFELVAEAAIGLAYFAHASELVVPQDELQPQASVNVGIGF